MGERISSTSAIARFRDSTWARLNGQGLCDVSSLKNQMNTAKCMKKTYVRPSVLKSGISGMRNDIAKDESEKTEEKGRRRPSAEAWSVDTMAGVKRNRVGRPSICPSAIGNFVRVVDVLFDHSHCHVTRTCHPASEGGASKRVSSRGRHYVLLLIRDATPTSTLRCIELRQP